MPAWVRYLLIAAMLLNVVWVFNYGGGRDGGLVWFFFVVNSLVLGLAYWNFFIAPGRERDPGK